MTFTLHPHEQKTDKSGRPYMQVNPYIRVMAGDGPPVFIQNGQYYSEGGQVLEEVPDWVPVEVEKLSEETKKSVGLDKSTAAKPKTAKKSGAVDVAEARAEAKPGAKKPEAAKPVEDKDVELKVEFKTDADTEIKDPKVLEVKKKP